MKKVLMSMVAITALVGLANANLVAPYGDFESGVLGDVPGWFWWSGTVNIINTDSSGYGSNCLEMVVPGSGNVVGGTPPVSPGQLVDLSLDYKTLEGFQDGADSYAFLRFYNESSVYLDQASIFLTPTNGAWQTFNVTVHRA